MTDKESFSKDTIEKVAKLALLELNEDDKEKFSKQLGNILSYFEKLNDLDTSDIEPTTHAIDLKNMYREDVPKNSLSNEDALKNAEHKKNGYFKAPRILKE